LAFHFPFYNPPDYLRILIQQPGMGLAGILRVNDLEALFDAVSTLGVLQPITDDRLALLTNGGGIGVMATDTLMYRQGTLAELSQTTMDRLNAALAEGRDWLMETEAKAVLSADDIPVIHSPQAHEVIIGMSIDPQFGPILLFGHGGTATEVIMDRAIALPALNMTLAREMIRATQISHLLAGYRDVPGVDMEKIPITLDKTSQLICDFNEILTLDINPFLCDSRGALDAHLRIQPVDEPAGRRLAICPYPAELEQTIELPDGQPVLLRPIRPEDEPAFQRFFSSLSPERYSPAFFASHEDAVQRLGRRLIRIDYDREMALVLTDDDQPRGGD
jgi:acetyltransferase